MNSASIGTLVAAMSITTTVGGGGGGGAGFLQPEVLNASAAVIKARPARAPALRRRVW